MKKLCLLRYVLVRRFIKVLKVSFPLSKSISPTSLTELLSPTLRLQILINSWMPSFSPLMVSHFLIPPVAYTSMVSCYIYTSRGQILLMMLALLVNLLALLCLITMLRYICGRATRSLPFSATSRLELQALLWCGLFRWPDYQHDDYKILHLS